MAYGGKNREIGSLYGGSPPAQALLYIPPFYPFPILLYINNIYI